MSGSEIVILSCTIHDLVISLALGEKLSTCQIQYIEVLLLSRRYQLLSFPFLVCVTLSVFL